MATAEVAPVHAYDVIAPEGADSTIFLPVVSDPPGAPTCSRGSNQRKTANFDSAGGVIDGPPEFVRPAHLAVHPQQGAPSRAFNFIEVPSAYPDVKAVGPANRPVQVKVSARGCTFDGTLVLYRLDGNSWVEVTPALVGADSSVTADLPSLQSRFALGTN